MARPPNLGTHLAVGRQEAAERSAFVEADSAGVEIKFTTGVFKKAKRSYANCTN